MNKPIKEIKPATYNPRKISGVAFQGLCESLKKFGMPQPLVVNKRTGVLVSGHQRLKAAEAIGWTEVPVVEVDLSPSEEKALNVTLNNRAIAGEFIEGLDELLAEIRLDLGDDFMASLRLGDVEIPEVHMGSNTEQLKKEVIGATELGEEEFREFAHRCPRCSFDFN